MAQQLHADQLRKTGATGPILQAIIRETLSMIDTKLTNAERGWGRNVVPVELNTSFPIPGLDKSNQQRLIYSSIVSNLKSRGFDVGLALEADRTTVYVAWETDLDPKQLAIMNSVILASKLNGPEQIEAFCTGRQPARADGAQDGSQDGAESVEGAGRPKKGRARRSPPP